MMPNETINVGPFNDQSLAMNTKHTNAFAIFCLLISVWIKSI